VTTAKSPRNPPKNRKSSTRAQPKRTAVSTAKAVLPAAPTSSATLNPAVSPTLSQTLSPATDEHASAGICVQLEPGLEIKDAEGVHRLLLAALGDGRAVTVDVGRVHAVDTAGAQLLLAFQGEASRRGVTVDFRGESAPLTHTLAVLGLRGKFLFAGPHG
jgi:anti-anti-sigma regulatory factor